MSDARAQGKVTGASVDWITATTTTPVSSKTLWDVGNKTLTESLPEGEYPTRWHAHGYEGWTAAGCSFGARADGVLLRLSGQKASNEWRAALAASDNVTRLDLAVDLEFESPKVRMARDLYRDAGHSPSRNGRPPTRSLVVSSDGGATCYIGKRSSEYMGRCYDKGVEQKCQVAGKWWRWELEIKGASALHVASELASSNDDRAYVLATTMCWFRARGANIPTAWNILEAGSLKPTIQMPSKRLEWLARCVRPTILDLVEGLGRERVLSVIGLS